MSTLTAEQVVTAAKRGAVLMATDPAMRHYSPDTLGLVYDRTVKSLAGAGSDEVVAERMANDPALSEVPMDVLSVLVSASFRHFAIALAEVQP